VSRRVRAESEELRLARETHLDILIAANRYQAELEEIVRGLGLTYTQYIALWTLTSSDASATGLPMSALRDRLLTPAADTTRLVARLEREGLAERVRSPDDGRSILVRVSDKGRKRFEAARPAVQGYHRGQFAPLTTDELALLRSLLRRTLWGM